MYDSFDMACHDEDNALRLNIRVNSENLLPTQQKYNVGSLRLPADPSWPKIPQRRLADDVGDLIQPPCIVTLTGTPRRSRTTVRMPQSQASKFATSKDSGNLISQHYCQKAQHPLSQQPKRRSGCADPRFKKVTTVKSQTTSTDPGDQTETNYSTVTESKECKTAEDKISPWKDPARAQVIQQKAEKPDETKGTESIGIQTIQTVSAEITSDMNGPTAELRSCSPMKRAQIKPELLGSNGTRGNLENNESLETNNLENQPDGSADNTQMKNGLNDRCTQQCYNVQVPVLSYQNVPVKVSTGSEPRVDLQIPCFKNIEIPKLELSNDTVPRFSSIATGFSNGLGKSFFDQEIENLGFQLKFDTAGELAIDKIQNPPLIDSRHEKSGFITESGKNFNDLKLQQQMQVPNTFNKTASPRERDAKWKYASNNQSIPDKNHRFKFQSSPEKLLKDIHNEEKCRPQQNVCKDFEPKHNFHIYCHQDKPRYHDTKPEIHKNDNCAYVQHQTTDVESDNGSPMIDNKQTHSTHPSERLDATFFDRIDDRDKKHLQSKYKTTQCLRQKRKMKSEQHLTLNKKRVQSSEPQITNGRRQSQAPYLKKANSYLSKCTQQLAPDSESIFVFQSQQKRDVVPISEANGINFIDCMETGKRATPHPMDVDKREHCNKPYQRPANKSTKITSSLDLDRQNSSTKKSPTANTIEKPTAIPVKTQQLLNKSYWDYYNKLKLEKMENGETAKQQYFSQVAMGAPQSQKRRSPELIVEESNNTSQTGDRVELSLPEIRTLEQCSVLSTMINKTLDHSALQPSSETIATKQIYLNGNMRSSSDPTAGTQSAILKKLFLGENEDSVVSSALMYKQKHKRDKRFDNKTLKLKSIGEHPVVFFGCMVYAMIVFLPMIYDYFSYEEQDEYEDLSYVEIAFDYMIASFKEAFGEFLDMVNKIFFKPDTRMQRLSSGRWIRQKIQSKHRFV